VIVGLRHARVDNPGNLVYARLPGFHLSERGREDASALARILASAPVAAVFSSPLERAVETASVLAEPLGLEVRTDDRLLEWSFWANWQGMPWTRIRERDPALLEAYANDPATASPDDPLGAAGWRILDWAAEADGRFDGPVIGVTHEAPLIAALLLGQGRGLDGFHTHILPHLGAVRLRPGPAEEVDLVSWARTC
jgi:broad specificity phosphatase PhoE